MKLLCQIMIGFFWSSKKKSYKFNVFRMRGLTDFLQEQRFLMLARGRGLE